MYGDKQWCGEDVSSGLLQQNDPQQQCLAYRRRLSTDFSDNIDGGPGQEQLWEKVCQHLGSHQTREYTISSVPCIGELSADQEEYLMKLSDDFVSDVKAMITQNLAKSQTDPATRQIVREILHHTVLAKEKLGTKRDDLNNSECYSELLHRIQSYVEDPKHRPFVIYGPADSDKSLVMSAVAVHISDWLSSSGSGSDWLSGSSSPVIVLRFIGSTTDSVDVQTCVSSLRVQIQLAYGSEVSTARKSLHCELCLLHDVLEQISARTKGPLFILLDGLEQLQPRGSALQALWALNHFPVGIYLIVTVSTDSGRQTDLLEALLGLVTDHSLKYKLGSTTDPQDGDHFSNGVALSRSLLSVEDLSSTLIEMEVDYGPSLVKYFASYLAVVNVGILDSEMFDLLVTNDEVMAERDGLFFSPGIVSILQQRLSDFLARRLVCGHVGFSWSDPAYRQAVAKHYQVTVEAPLGEESTKFAVALHQHIVQLYQDVTKKSPLFGTDPSLPEDSSNKNAVRTTFRTLGPDNSIAASRLLQHLCALLPVQGLNQVKLCVLFNLDWLMTRLATAPVFQVVSDVLSVLDLCQEMDRQQRIETDSFEDITVLFEFLQMSSKALAINHLSLPSEVVARLGSSSFVQMSESVAQLVLQSRHYLDNTESLALVPVWSVWNCPGGMWRHVLDGVSCVVGMVDSGEAVIACGQDRVSIWSTETGMMLQSFALRPGQPLSGVIAGHRGAFIVTSHFSRATSVTELNVLSTETGLMLLTANMPHHFEALTLSPDDQLIVVSSVQRVDDADCGNQPARFILGFDITSRSVVLHLLVVSVHSQGIYKDVFVVLKSIYFALFIYSLPS